MYLIIVLILTLLGGQPFAGLDVGDGVMHPQCVEAHVIVCSDGFVY